MKHSLALGAVWGALLVLTTGAGAQPAQLPEPLLAQSFEEEQQAQSWLGLGEGAKVLTERAPNNVKVGTGSLRFEYQVAPRQMNVLVSAVAPPSLATLESISFWIKADHTASFAFALQEQNGGRFGTTFSVVKDQWQRVEIAPQDLVLQVDRDAPKDADGKLDREKIEGVALLDFSQLLAQLAADPQNPIARMLGVETGPRVVFLDDLTFSSKPLSPKAPDNSFLDDFNHPQAAWMSVGDVALKAVKGEADQPNSLQADYSQAAGKVPAFAKFLSPGVLEGKTTLSFDVTSKRHATLIVQLEETSGGKYNMVCDVPGTDATTPQKLSFAEFKPSDDSKDDNNRLDLAQVKQVLFIDASGLLGVAGGDNTLRLSSLRAK